MLSVLGGIRSCSCWIGGSSILDRIWRKQRLGRNGEEPSHLCRHSDMDLSQMSKLCKNAAVSLTLSKGHVTNPLIATKIQDIDIQGPMKSVKPWRAITLPCLSVTLTSSNAALHPSKPQDAAVQCFCELKWCKIQLPRKITFKLRGSVSN